MLNVTARRAKVAEAAAGPTVVGTAVVAAAAVVVDGVAVPAVGEHLVLIPPWRANAQARDARGRIMRRCAPSLDPNASARNVSR